MAIPIIKDWEKYFSDPHEGLGSSYERIILNRLLLRVADTYEISSALETPSFGFTGVSGINLVPLAKRSISVTLEDHDPQRLERLTELWAELKLPLTTALNQDYQRLAYPADSFDLGYNFSALWFVSNLPEFIAEFCRVCRKAILICVPNRQGLGFRMQIKDYSPSAYPFLHPGHIDPRTIIYLMRNNGWKLVEQNFIDCPPWPDIGMNKELWLAKLLGRQPEEPKPTPNPVSILPYYRGQEPAFEPRMLNLSWLERYAPNWFKRFWAHHLYLLFIPE